PRAGAPPRRAPGRVGRGVAAGRRPARVRVAPRRSPVRAVADALALARACERTGRLRVRGVMFYEGQVAGVNEAGLTAPVVRAMKAASLAQLDRKSTRLNSSHVKISYAVFCLTKQKQTRR